MSGIPFALGASLSWGFSNYAGGVASRSLRVPVVLWISQLAGFVLLLPVVLASGSPDLSASDAAWAVLAGSIAVLSLGLMFRGMAVGLVSIVGPVSACGVAIPVIVGLAQGERPHAAQIAGIAAAVAGIILVSSERDAERPGRRRLVAGLGLALGAALAVGSWFVVFDAAADNDPYWASLVARSATAAVVTLVVIAQRKPAGLRGTAPLAIVLVLASGLGDATGELLYALATNEGLMSIVSVIASLYPAFMVLLAAVFLRERLAPRQLVGVVAALVGVALISAG